jgi:1-acyl-sn-glycerol-3-phosphate acyltransferase
MADRTPSRGKGRSGATGAAAVAAGAARASGERARRQRRTTPLLTEPEPDGQFTASEQSASEQSLSKESPSEPRPPVARPTARPTADSPAAPRKTPRRPSRPPRRPTFTAAPPSITTAPEATPVKDAPPAVRVRPAAVGPAAGRTLRVRTAASRRTPGGERLVAVADAAEQAGQSLVDALTERKRSLDQVGTAELQRRIAGVLAFLRRRLTGDFSVDEFGFDPELTDTVLLGLARPLYRRWFRVEVRGIENIPDSTGALIVANHSGAIALDALMTQVAVHDEHPKHRHLRMLGADLVFSTPVLGEVARKGGATLASNADAERLLSAGEVVGVWPEGFKGIGKPFSERYKLQRFGRGGFVSAALKTGAPIVPCAIVGAEETYPIIGDMPSVARLLGLPYAPITPTWPLLGLLGLIPLPSKWLIEFGTPLPTHEIGSAAAEDPMMVFDLTDRVRQTIQQTLYSLLVQRRSVFF